jgi:hypothetical protein
LWGESVVEPLIETDMFVVALWMAMFNALLEIRHLDQREALEF